MRARSSFTLIELLLIIGIIAILATIVIVAINPSKSVSEARDNTRKSDVNLILNAVYQYAVENNGDLPAGIPTGSLEAAKVICQESVKPSDCARAPLYGVNLRMLTGAYVGASMPRDPLVTETGTGTAYMIVQDVSGRITVFAAHPERTDKISATR